MSRGAVNEFAPAKVNLTLAVGPAGADGYHPLDSLVVFADWGDAISVGEGDGLSLQLKGPGADSLKAEPKNLVLKAAYALRAAVERPDLSASIVLDKTLPVAAGLGGGSVDAAAALRALARFWELDLSRKQLAEIGSVVGSDVPACVHSRPLRMTGRGERIAPLVAWPGLDAVIANPGVPVATKDVFEAYDATGPQILAQTPPPAAGTVEQALDWIAAGANHLQPSALHLEPAIAETLKALRALQGCRLARMSGSGASCFAPFDDERAARAGADALSAARPHWIVRPVHLAGAVA